MRQANGCLQPRICNRICMPRPRDAPKNLGIDRIAQISTKSLNLVCCLLVDGTALHRGRPGTVDSVGFTRGPIRLRKRPAGSVGNLIGLPRSSSDTQVSVRL